MSNQDQACASSNSDIRHLSRPAKFGKTDCTLTFGTPSSTDCEIALVIENDTRQALRTESFVLCKYALLSDITEILTVHHDPENGSTYASTWSTSDHTIRHGAASKEGTRGALEQLAEEKPAASRPGIHAMLDDETMFKALINFFDRPHEILDTWQEQPGPW